MLMNKLQRRLRHEEGGFTLIELLVVLVIIGILLAIAVPSYLGFKDRANKRAAASNIRAAIPTAEAYYSDNNTYVGMTTVNLRAIDSGLSHSLLAPTTLTTTTYCLSATVGGFTYHVNGPGGTVTNGVC